jgi:hypothetical protein
MLIVMPPNTCSMQALIAILFDSTLWLRDSLDDCDSQRLEGLEVLEGRHEFPALQPTPRRRSHP